MLDEALESLGFSVSLVEGHNRCSVRRPDPWNLKQLIPFSREDAADGLKVL
jgi:hypothetical protein